MLTPNARSNTRWLSLTIVLALGLLGLLPLAPTLEFLLATSMAWAVAAVGLDIFSGYLGQPSFGHIAFVGLGAYSVTILRTEAHFPVGFAVICGLVIVAALAALIGLALVRLHDFGLVLGTFFLCFVTTSLLAGTTFAGITKSESGLEVPTVTLGGLDLSSGKPYYYLCAVLLLLTVVLSSNYADSRAGRALRLVKRSGTVAEAIGVSSKAVKLKALVYSAVLSGVAGILLAMGAGYIAPENFTAEQSIILFAMVAVGGLGSIAGPILGALVFTLAPNYLQGARSMQELVFAALLLASLVLFRSGMFGLLESGLRHLRPRRPHPISPVASGHRDVGPLPSSPRVVARRVLDVDHVSVKYDGIHALEDVTFTLDAGEVNALIGPNGAGKTTMLNCINGLEPPSAGLVTVRGEPVARRGVSRARRVGVSRTFQNPSLVPDLTSTQNVMLGLYYSNRSSLARDLLRLDRGRERAARQAADQALVLVGVDPARFATDAADLSLADAKLVDIARAVVMQGDLLVMDEPTAGLSGAEMAVIAGVIRRLEEQTGAGVLVVSHHVAWVKQVAANVIVLAAGRVIAHGTPAAVIADRRVREVFLGETAPRPASTTPRVPAAAR